MVLFACLGDCPKYAHNAAIMVPVLNFDTVAACAVWQTIDDQVMGGNSISRLSLAPQGWAVFEGQLSLYNGEGFASVRTSTRVLSRAGAAGYRLNVLGDGRRYKFNLRTDVAFEGLTYQSSFQPPAGVWSEMMMLVAAMRPTLRGRLLPRAPRLQPERVNKVGLMIADGQAGPFALGIRSVTVF
jgi:monofunctional biosynthetic peptidoglycan transglycosylase